MSQPVTLAEPAFEDLRRNARWWAKHHSLEQAQNWHDGLLLKLDSLSRDAERCPLARENAEFPYELREVYFGVGSRPTHRALFTIHLDAIVVLTIRHAAQDDVTPDDF